MMKEQQTEKEKSPSGIKQSGWKRWLNYQSVVKQLPFFLFLTGLAVLYIYNGHFADNTIRQINKTAKDVKELKYEYTILKGEVMALSKPGEVAKAVEPLGLKVLTESPIVLKDSVNVVKNNN